MMRKSRRTTVKRERGEEEESECVSECVSEGVMQKKRKTVSKRQVKEEQHTVTPLLTHSLTHSLVPDPFALDLIRKTSGKKSGSGVTAKVSEDPSSGDPCAVSLSLPHSTTATTTVEKFYIIQLLTVDVDSGSVYYLFSRWGNKGEDGYTELSPALSTLTAAMKAFEQRFKIKTANKWSARHNFKPQSFHFQLHAHSPSGDVTSGDVTSGDVTSSDVKEEHVPPPPTTVSSKKTTSTSTTVSKSSVTTSCNEKLVRLVYLECREGSADKFYELKQTESHSVTIRYGRRLSPGVTSIKAFSTAAEAKSFVDKTAIAKQRKGYSNAKAPSVEEEEEEANDAPAAEQAELSGDQAVDLENGHRVFVQGSSKLPYTLKKFNGGYSCTCMGWVGQIRMKGVQAATCKHLKQVRGEEVEAIRCNTNAGIVANPSNKANKNPSIVSRISLAQKWKPTIDPTGYLMSEKLDGMRAYWCGKKLWTRSGLPVITPEWFTAGLPTDTELDGELFLGRKMFDECMSITRRTDASEDWKKIKYVIFDAPKVAGGIASRLEHAKEVLTNSGNEYALVHPHTLCEGIDHLLGELAAMEEAGGEGMMLRSATARHRGGRNVDLLKVKSFHDDEAIVTEYEAGKGKYTGMVGSLVCRSRHGAAFKVGSGLVDSQRSYQSKSLPPIGSVITFQYFELTKDGIPRFPTYLRIRPDVDPSEFD